MQQEYEFIRRSEVQRMTGLSRSTIYELLSRSDFPKPVNMSGGGGRLRVWIKAEVRQWLDKRIADR